MNIAAIVAVVVLSAVFLALKDLRKSRKKRGKRAVTQALQEFLPIEGFDESGAMTVNGQLRKLVQVGNANLYAMSRSAIQIMRDDFQAMMGRLEYPFQLSAQARKANYADYLEYAGKTLRETAQAYNTPDSTAYAEHLFEHLKAEARKPRTDRQNLIVVSVLPKIMGADTSDAKRARLAQEEHTVLAGLLRMGLPYALLSDIAQAEAIQNFWSRDRAVSQRYRDLHAAGVHTPVVTGLDVREEDVHGLRTEESREERQKEGA